MLEILPIMLCCTAQNFAYYALINAQYLPIMLKLCSIFYSPVPMLCYQICTPLLNNILSEAQTVKPCLLKCISQKRSTYSNRTVSSLIVLLELLTIPLKYINLSLCFVNKEHKKSSLFC